ncbi:SusC/RagA family TonB-linked outer membrane protein [Flavivirga rizhaonensis]|uniref:TonB-dependent receptor n=1 Tax=Flavivirga rizhaonensis TaxID=2559571 RepID=A0A4V3P4B3_9FLAO|nr:TonB-dependent receptor [Flavivirga rizhaonensis]TGV00784.1 TonB-dependent receptor [Flavivirga rizhaonensis]
MKLKSTYDTKKPRSICLLFVFLCFYGTLLGQNLPITVKGIVTSSEDGLPIPGVAVVLQKSGKTTGAVTDFDGAYRIEASIGDELIFSYIGMRKVNQKVIGPQLNVQMDPETNELEEVVVIGFGTQKKKEVTGAVSQVKAEEIENVITSDIGQALQGQIAGVSVTANSGEPGEGSGILIRGVSSLTGSNSPLWVIDGVPQSNGDPGLNPNEIETIDVLKDAASAAIYGTRAAGGVILVTTKKGKPGNTRINLEFVNGFQIITRQTPLMNTQEQIFFDLNNPIRNGSPARSDRFSLLNDNDLRDLTENDFARISRYNVNMSGGNNDANYSIVMGFFEQDGIVVNSSLKRYNLRANLELKKDKWSFDNGFGFTIDDRERPNFNLLILGQRAFPYLDEVGTGSSNVINENDESAGPLQQVLEALTRDRQVDRYRFEARSNIKYKINDNLELTTLIAGVFTNQKEKQVQPRFNLFDSNGVNLRSDEDSFVFEGREETVLINWNGGINYKQQFGKHNIGVLALMNIEQDFYTSIGTINKGLSFATPTNLSLGTVGAEAISSGTISVTRGTINVLPDYRIKRVGTIGRIQYDFDDKYLFSASARIDASNQFSKDNRSAFFPSISAGWNISEEKFWRGGIKRTINNLKLRGSIGTTGNDRFAPNAIFSPVTTNYNANFSSGSGTNSLNPGIVQQSFGNPALKWEVTTQKNIGIDLNMWKNKLTFTADYYTTDKKDLLSNIRLNPSFGAPATAERFQGTNFAVFNVGNMTNEGFEASLRYRPRTGKVRWNILGTLTTNKNRVTSINGNLDQQLFPTLTVFGDIESLATGLRVGREAGSFLLFETDGLLRTQQEVDDYNTQFPGENAQLGDLRYVDVNGNGALRDEADRVYKGSGLPDYEVGLNIQATYKNWFFATNWYGSFGNEVYNATRANAMRQGRHKDLLFQFIPGVNEDTNIPAYRSNNRGDANFNGSSDFFVEDGSFIRLRNIVVSYSLPKDVTEKLGFSRFNIYANAQNALVISKYTGLDPEVGGNNIQVKGIDRGLIPISASFNLGLRLNF